MRSAWVLLSSIAVAVATVAACSGGDNTSGFTSSDGGGGGHPDASGNGGDGGSNDDGGLVLPTGDGAAYDAPPPAQIPVVYAHSASDLYKLDPMTKAVSVVGPFKSCSSVIDIAIDSASNAYVTTSSNFYKLDLATATCTKISSGNYPNSLSFVPKGTLDANAEALVGYFGSSYVRIDTSTGNVSTIGSLTGGYQSSGDIVSVIGGGTFLTVNGNGCSDCLLQIDPKTGDIVQSYGDVKHQSVFGLAFWAGTVYGFDDAGDVFSIGWQNNQLVTTDIPVPNPPANLSFWGAGSTTAAPPKDANDGGIPVK